MAANDINALVRVIALLLGQNEERAEEIVKWAYGGSQKKKEPAKPPVKRLAIPFQSDRFTEAWNSLLVQPKWRTKTNKALQLSLNKLAKYDEAFAIQLIETAIERGWQGVVFDDTDERYKQWKLGKSYRPNQEPDKNDVNSLWNR